jgi:hypothetical protein
MSATMEPIPTDPKELIQFIKSRRILEFTARKEGNLLPYKETLEYILGQMFMQLPEDEKPLTVDPNEIKIPIPSDDVLIYMRSEILEMDREQLNDMFKHNFAVELINPMSRQYSKETDIGIMEKLIKENYETQLDEELKQLKVEQSDSKNDTME